MSTEVLEPDTIPMSTSHEVGVPEAEMLDAVEDHELARAEDDGMIPVEPVPPEPAEEGPSEEEATAMKLALADLYSVQDRLDEAASDFETKNERAKTAKKRVEALQDDLQAAVRRLREVKRDTQPDPLRYPLLDKPDAGKASINAEFAPAETIEQFFAKKRAGVSLASLELGKAATKKLDELGLFTMQDWTLKQDSQIKFGKSMLDLDGITEKRFEQIMEAFAPLAEAWMAEWKEAHGEVPESTDPVEETEVDCE